MSFGQNFFPEERFCRIRSLCLETSGQKKTLKVAQGSLLHHVHTKTTRILVESSKRPDVELSIIN